MSDKLVFRLTALGSLLGIAAIVVSIILRISLGRELGPEDFSQSVVLQQLYLAGPNVKTAALLALIGPILLLVGGIGWHVLLRARGSLVLLATTLWIVGMIFVIWQAAITYSLVSFLPQTYVPAAELPLSTGLVAAGGTLGVIIRTTSAVGDAVSLAGVALLGIVLWQQGARLRLLGALAFGAALLTWAGLLGLEMAPLRLIGQAILLVWIAAMAVVMLRGMPPSNPAEE